MTDHARDDLMMLGFFLVIILVYYTWPALPIVMWFVIDTVLELVTLLINEAYKYRGR